MYTRRHGYLETLLKVNATSSMKVDSVGGLLEEKLCGFSPTDSTEVT